MDFKNLLNAIADIHTIIIKHDILENKIFYQGFKKDIPDTLIKERWLVAEVKLSDKNNYNSTYIITVF